jgi:ligand-binding sensor domain-containing protein
MRYQPYAAKLCCRLLIALISTTSCNAQNKTGSLENNATARTEYPKLPRTSNSHRDNVHCGLQDKAGNLWFGTTGDGVYRYDGKAFVNYTEKDGLGNNRVFAMLEDKDGFIWIGTDAGVCRYDGKTFTRVALPVTGSSGFFIAGEAAATTAVWSMMQDQSGKIWFGTRDDGIVCYDGKAFTRFLDSGVKNESKLRIDAVNSIVEDASGNIWFATWFEGLCRYVGKAVTGFKPNNEVWFSSILEDKDGVLWIGRRTKGLMRCDPALEHATGSPAFTNVRQNGTLDSCSADALLQDKSGAIWFGSIHSRMTMRETSGGLWRYDAGCDALITAEEKVNNDLHKCFTNITANDGLPNNDVWCAVEDRDGFIWMGTTHTGLYRFDPSALGPGSKAFVSFSE